MCKFHFAHALRVSLRGISETIPDGVVELGAGAFAECKGLVEVSPFSLQALDSSADASLSGLVTNELCSLKVRQSSGRVSAVHDKKMRFMTPLIINVDF
eukprot:m.311924 g.311924  ORF g.311924 m.311924 type:complete len:99 (+) comp16392_c0_seq12:2267-2563(+)